MEESDILRNFREYAAKAEKLWNEEEYDESRGWTDLAYEEAEKLTVEEKTAEDFRRTFWKVSMDMAMFLWEDDMDAEHALTALRHALSSASGMPEGRERSGMLRDALLREADILKTTGRTAEALAKTEEAVSAAESAEDKVKLAEALLAASELSLEEGFFSRTVSYSEKLLTIAEGMDESSLAHCETIMAEALEKTGCRADAEAHLHHAAMILEDSLISSTTAAKAEELSDILIKIYELTEDPGERKVYIRKAQHLMDTVVSAMPWDEERRSKFERVTRIMEEEEMK